MANINDFKSRLQSGGARANQFEVHMNFPAFAGDSTDAAEMTFLCTSTTTPASTVSEVPVAFRGRTLYLAGDRTFETWSTTVINDTDFKIYRACERWLNGMNTYKFKIGKNPKVYEGNVVMIKESGYLWENKKGKSVYIIPVEYFNEPS